MLSALPGSRTAAAQVYPPRTSSDTLYVTIFHSNDVNGVLERQRSPDGFLGGMAPRVHVIRQARQRGRVVVLDAGNALGPSPLSAWDQGASMIDVMRIAGYDALLPANHEFDYGLGAIRRHRALAGFPFLGTNFSVDEDEDTFASSVLLDLDGLRIGIIGLISANTATLTNPKHLSDVEFLDPHQAAAAENRRLRGEGVDYIIALTNMDEAATLDFARGATQVDLVIAGGYQNAGSASGLPGLIRLVNGMQIVTTPDDGVLLGEITLKFLQGIDGSFKVVQSDAQLRRVDASVPEDHLVGSIVARAAGRYTIAAGDTLGVISGGSHYDQTHMVADMIRDYTEAEVGILNFGLIQYLKTDLSLIRRDINRFIRFPNMIEVVELTGAQLKSVVAQSKRSARTNARLAFSGLDEDALTVEGRPLRDSERYLVAVTDFLTNGGDGYRQFAGSPVQQELGKSLRSLLQETLLSNGRLAAHGLDRIRRRGIWQSGLQFEGAFERNYVDRTTDELRARNEQVPFLSGATTIAWSGALRYFLERASGPHITRYQQRMDFSQIGQSFDDLTASKDQVELEARYRYRTSGNRGDPFVSVGLNTALTDAGGQRPMQQVSTVGFEYQLFPSLIARVAGRSQWDFVADKIDMGGEVTLEWTRALPSNVSLRSRVRSFFGVTNRRVVSVENYNTIGLPLLGDLRLNVRQNNFLYRVNQVRGIAADGVAVRSILTLGFAYGLNWKWL